MVNDADRFMSDDNMNNFLDDDDLGANNSLSGNPEFHDGRTPDDDDSEDGGGDNGSNGNDTDDGNGGEGGAGNGGSDAGAGGGNPGGAGPGSNEGMTDEELLKLANPEGDASSQQAPTEFNNSFEIAKYFGISIDGKKPEEVKMEDIKAQFDHYKKVATSDDFKEVSNLKQFLVSNPDKTELDYFNKFISPYESLMYMDPSSLLMAKLTMIDKLTPEAAAEKLDQMKFDKTFEEEEKKFRNLVNNKNQEFYQNRDASLEQLAKQRKADVVQKRQDLMSTMIKEKNTLFSDTIVLTNTDVKNCYDKIVSGEINKRLADHKVMAKVAYFLENESKFIELIKQDAENAQKIFHINHLANAKQNHQRRQEGSAANSKASNDYLAGWDD